MDFIDQMKVLSARIPEQLKYAKNEEASGKDGEKS